VILNLALLATIWYPKLNPPEKVTPTEPKKQEHYDKRYIRGEQDRKERNKRLAGFLKKELNFTRDQIDKFMQLRDEHFQKTKQLRRQVDDLRREMMDQLLVDQPDSSQVEKLTGKMGQKTAELEKTVFYHFIELMELCDSEQKSKYKSLLREILNQLKPPDHHPAPGAHPPPGDHPREPAGRPPEKDREQEERRPPPRDDQGGHNHAEKFFNRLRHQLQLTGSQANKAFGARPIFSFAFYKKGSGLPKIFHWEVLASTFVSPAGKIFPAAIRYSFAAASSSLANRFNRGLVVNSMTFSPCWSTRGNNAKARRK